MKIGILTFHRAINYGASLQAYALTKKMNEMGYEAEIVDYRNPHIENMFHNFSINKIISAAFFNFSVISSMEELCTK